MMAPALTKTLKDGHGIHLSSPANPESRMMSADDGDLENMWLSFSRFPPLDTCLPAGPRDVPADPLVTYHKPKLFPFSSCQPSDLKDSGRPASTISSPLSSSSCLCCSSWDPSALCSDADCCSSRAPSSRTSSASLSSGRRKRFTRSAA
uniref:Uncharacterized protein n=1 Tax=Gasterosteus aculeatus TaxID=69293 RepID=G3NTR0_GASAC